jgi:ketosteroid isomerase-like protein
VWRIETFAQSGDKLLMEGYEEYTDTTNGKRVVNRYMGVMEFRDGRIARWRDYFQLDKQPDNG